MALSWTAKIAYDVDHLDRHWEAGMELFRQLRAGDMLNVGAITAPASLLFGFVYGFFAGPHVGTLCLWIIGAVVVATLTWFMVANTLRRERENRERAQADRAQAKLSEARIVHEIRLALLQPNANLGDVAKIVQLESWSLAGASGMAAMTINKSLS
jgi:hypothetical protein